MVVISQITNIHYNDLFVFKVLLQSQPIVIPANQFSQLWTFIFNVLMGVDVCSKVLLLVVWLLHDMHNCLKVNKDMPAAKM